MIITKKRETVDSSLFDTDINPPSIFGLPPKVKYCRKCVISNQRPSSTVEYLHTKDSKKNTIVFDDTGLCSACKLAEDKRGKIDWAERKEVLHELCDRYRGKGAKYDCICPGSGGKDSIYASHVLKTEFGMNPLTVTWAPNIYTEWGWRNFQRWLSLGFDNYLVTPNPKVHRLLTRLAVENLFHPFQLFIIGQKALAAKTAILFDIPLVFYGESNAEYGSPVEDSSRRDEQFYALKGSEKIFFGGVSINDLGRYFGVKERDLTSYMPADPAQVRKLKLEVHNLGYYIKWHPQSCYYHAVEHAGFEASPERTPGTYSKYNSIDDKLDDLHYFTTWIKFGIGRAIYDAAQEIRSGDITREEGVALAGRYDGEFPERFAEEIFDYLSITPREFPEAAGCFEQPIMTRDYFMELADTFRSPHIWKRDNGQWVLRHPVE